jgi:ribosomal-protein-alanine N-acetyltransferase
MELIYLDMHIIVQTPRMIIREFSPDEQQVFLNHFTDEEVCLHLPKRTTDERITIFGNALNNYKVTKQTGTWGMFNKTNDEFIGSCLLRPFNGEPERIEVGYSMDKKYWGQGLGTEMTKAMVEYAFEDENVIKVVGCTTMENIGSQRVLEKAGLKRVDDMLRDGVELAFFVAKR